MSVYDAPGEVLIAIALAFLFGCLIGYSHGLFVGEVRAKVEQQYGPGAQEKWEMKQAEKRWAEKQAEEKERKEQGRKD